MKKPNPIAKELAKKRLRSIIIRNKKRDTKIKHTQTKEDLAST